MKNKKGFTLIELLAVIIILVILMVIAIPAVTRYINDSKKEAFIKEVNSLADTVRYGINSGDSNYSMNGQTKRTFALQDILLEKGDKTITSGTLTVDSADNSYKVKVSGSRYNYCLKITNINNLDKSSIKDCNSSEYVIGNEITYANTNWYVIEESKMKDDYVVLLKKYLLTAGEIDSNYSGKNYGKDTNRIGYYWSNTCFSNFTGSYCPNTASGSSDYSGCNDHSNFETSKINEALLAYIEEKKMTNDLVPVDLDGTSYKIRLITLNELQEKFGLSREKLNPQYYNYYYVTQNLYPWIYSFGINTHSYWTMTRDLNSNYSIFVVSDSKQVYSKSIGTCDSSGVRPVINLLKSAIE